MGCGYRVAFILDRSISGGHSDLLCGVVATKNEESGLRLFWKIDWLLGTLWVIWMCGVCGRWKIRVQRASQNAAELIAWLQRGLNNNTESESESTPAKGSEDYFVQTVVEKIHHVSLQDEPWVRKQMPNGFGPVFSLVLRNEDFARRLPI